MFWRRQTQTNSPEPPATADEAVDLLPGGAAGAQFALGLKFASAPDDDRDYSQALQYYLKAAAGHHPLAQFNLGIMYSLGQGVPRDPNQACEWFRVAAEHGDAGAQYQLARLYERAALETSGPHAAEFRTEAWKWYRLAAAQGYGEAEMALHTLSLRIPRHEAEEARRRAESFRPGIGA